MPMSRKVSTIYLQCVENDSIALIEKFSVGCGNTVGHFTAEFDKWILP